MRSDLTCPIEIVAVEVKRGEFVPEIASRASAEAPRAKAEDDPASAPVPGETEAEKTPASADAPADAGADDEEEEASAQEEPAPVQEQILCEIEFLCLIDKVIESVQMNIVCFDAENARLGGRLVRAHVHELEAPGRFAGVFMPEHVDGTVRVEAAVEKVWFKDGVVWRREERNVREYKPNTLPEGRELDRLRSVAGPDAMGYARQEDVLWMCVCGRANPIGEEICLKCRRERIQVVKAYSYATIDATVGRRERELERQTMDSLRRSSEQTAQRMTQEQKKRRRRKRRVTAAIALLAVVAVGLAAWRWGVPYVATEMARQKLHDGLAEEAKSLFEWVDARWPGQFDAAALATQAEINIIEALIGTNVDVSLEEAAARAKALDTPTAQALYERAMLARAALAQNSGDTDAAEAIYRAMPESQEATQRLQALIYAVADEAQGKLDYPTAIERFASLGDYEDARARREDCIYLYGRHLLRNGQYALAAEQFLQVADMEDALDLARYSTYQLAQVEEDQGLFAEAAERFESLGVYEEAIDHARASRYQAGIAALEAGDLEQAVEHLRRAGDYEDAVSRFEETVYALGDEALEAGDPLTAVTWYEQLSRTEASVQARNEATYALAQQYEDDGLREDAALTYASLGDYEDAPERARALEYAIAMDELSDSPEAALARLEGLGDYADAPEQAQRCRYLIAASAYASGEYERAVSLFEQLGDYDDSESQLRRSRYALAGKAAGEGAFDEAAALYESCGAYLDAEELALRARYDGASALEAQGELSRAARAFRALGSYDDAPARAQAAEDAWLGAPYASATMDMELGDYSGVMRSLEDVWQEELPARYADIPALYRQACLLRAQELIDQNRPLEAMPILEGLPEDKAAQEMLSAYVYRVVGTWEASGGKLYIFRRDGSCSIAGEEGYFGGRDYDIFVGDAPNPTRRAYSVVNLRGETLTLRDASTNSTIRLHYVGEPTALVEPDEDGETEEDASALREEEAPVGADGESEAESETES